MTFHPHQHSVKVIASAPTLEKALSNALAGLVDPKGHYGHMSIQSFEVSRIAGKIDTDGSIAIHVTVEAYASHKD